MIPAEDLRPLFRGLKAYTDDRIEREVERAVKRQRLREKRRAEIYRARVVSFLLSAGSMAGLWFYLWEASDLRVLEAVALVEWAGITYILLFAGGLWGADELEKLDGPGRETAPPRSPGYGEAFARFAVCILLCVVLLFLLASLYGTFGGSSHPRAALGFAFLYLYSVFIVMGLCGIGADGD